MSRSLVRRAVSTLALLVCVSGSPLASLSKRTPTGPVLSENFPDPCIVFYNNEWYSFATRTLDTTINIPMAKSSDFNTWEPITANGQNVDALPTVPSWVDQSDPNTWAPDVNVLDDGSFVMYYSASSSSDNTKHCVGAATATSITGPYTPLPSPMFCPLSDGGAIDPAGFKDGNSRYVVYKVDGNSIGNGGPCGNTVDPIVSTPLQLQQVGADGVTPVGGITTLLDNSGASDDGIVEAPAMIKSSAGKYFLFFSSGCYTTDDYTVSYAVADSVRGPYTRNGTPLLKTGDYGLYGPGGADLSFDARHVVFHANNASTYQGTRLMHTGLITISGETVSI